MTRPDALQLFRDKCDQLGQSRVAKELGISPSAVSQLYHGKYQASPDTILQRVVEIFGGISVACSVLGDIPLARCAEERKKPFAATNSQRVELWRACRNCNNNGGKQ